MSVSLAGRTVNTMTETATPDSTSLKSDSIPTFNSLERTV